MYTGKGTLVLQGGRKLPVQYEFGGNYDDTRVGYLLLDTAELDPGALFDRLTVTCDDGAEVVVAVIHSSDRHLAVIGRVLPAAA